MRSKAYVISWLIFVTGLFIASGVSVSAESTCKECSRYQLLSGKHLAVGKGQSVEMNNVFKIDTATGQTWIFIYGIQDNGSFTQEWRPIKQ